MNLPGLTRLLALGAAAALLAGCGNDDEPSAASAAACSAPAVAGGPGGRIVAVADVDMLASAYGDNQLGAPIAGLIDQLVLFEPSTASGARPRFSGSAAVSNAVTGPAWVFDVDPQRQRAYVVETNPPPPAGVTTLSALVALPGNTLTAVDLCAGSGPAVIARVRTADSPTTVSMRADGRLLAVAARFPARLVTHEVDARGDIGAAVAVQLPPDIAPRPDDPFQEITQALWSPDGRWLAVFVRGTRKLQIFEARGTPAAPALTPVGPAVDIDEGTFGGKWAPDGRTLGVINVLALSRPASELMALVPTLSPAQIQALLVGSVQVVEVFGADGRPAPRVVQTLPSPAFPEGIAFSADGLHVATVSLQTTALPSASPLFSPQSVLSLYTRDARNGLLRLVSHAPFDGILPESVDFDPTGSYLAVAVFHPSTAETAVGAIDVWQLRRADRAGFATGVERLYRANGPRGLHVLRWLR